MATKNSSQPKDEATTAPALIVEDSVTAPAKPAAKPVATTEVNGMVIEDY